jgi:hypothetical protein
VTDVEDYENMAANFARMEWARWLAPWRRALEQGLELAPTASTDEMLAAGCRVLVRTGELELEPLRAALLREPPSSGASHLLGDDALMAEIFERNDRWPDRGVLKSLSSYGSGRMRAFVASSFPADVLALAYQAIAEPAGGDARRELRDLLKVDAPPDEWGDEWPEQLLPALYYADPPREIDVSTPLGLQIEHHLRAFEASQDRYLRRSLADGVRAAAEADLPAFATALPLHLALAESHRDDLIVSLAIEHKEIRDSLERLATDGTYPHFRRADGMLRAIKVGDLATLTSTYRWWVDRDLYSVPTSLPAPASTWLGDGAVEHELRARFDNAARRLPSAGISEETEVTGALIANLVAAAERDLPVAAGLAPPVRMDIISTNATTHEPLSGADIGIVVRVELPQRSRVETGHLVQVKQSLTRDDETVPPRWKVTRDQIDLMLEDDPTATYWLLSPWEPKLVVVPAKTLLARFEQSDKSYTLQYDDIRSAGVPLGNALVDLLLGLWLGTPSALGVARGLGSRHKPGHILEITLGTLG